MKALTTEALENIAVTRGIVYTPLESARPNGIRTAMSREFAVERSELFEKVADLSDHTRLFDHLKAINVIDSASVAGVIGENQYLIVEGIAEGASKLGVKLVTLTPPERIDCELHTDLFTTAKFSTADPKSGAISWKFDDAGPGRTRLSVESDFEVQEKTNYARGSVDHVWFGFFENLMADFDEISSSERLSNPFPDE